MKNFKTLSALATFAIAMGFAFFPSLQPSAFAAGEGIVAGVHVNGTGIIAVNPDTAIINIGVESSAKTSKEAQRKNSYEMKKLIESLEASGVKKEDIKTQWFSIYPEYDYSKEGSPREIGFKASHTLEVKIRNLEAVTDVIDTATASGADNVNSIQYALENKEETINQARALAIKDAQKKAENLGKILGITLGKVLSVSEYSDSGIMPMNYSGGALMKAESATDNVFNPGKIEIRLDINISYGIQ